jgi:hypothetical protein
MAKNRVNNPAVCLRTGAMRLRKNANPSDKKVM